MKQSCSKGERSEKKKHTKKHSHLSSQNPPTPLCLPTNKTIKAAQESTNPTGRTSLHRRYQTCVAQEVWFHWRLRERSLRKRWRGLRRVCLNLLQRAMMLGVWKVCRVWIVGCVGLFLVGREERARERVLLCLCESRGWVLMRILGGAVWFEVVGVMLSQEVLPVCYGAEAG